MALLKTPIALIQVVFLLIASVLVTAAPVERRAVIPHNAVVGFAQAVPNDAIGASYLRYKPWLEVVNGCVPFPAVNAAGDTGGGLATSGASNGGCSSSPGQVYVRGAWFGDRYGILYSWYMPKDSPSSGLGHRHDWEGIVVWVNDPNLANPTILAVSTSAHGDFDTTTSPPLDGTRPKIMYFSIFPINHQLGVTNTRGGEQPLIAWESLTDAARTALSDTDFGSATVPFKDSTLQSNLQKASDF